MPLPNIIYPLINGNRYDFTSLTIMANGIPVKGIKEISYTKTLEPGDVYGTSAQLLGRTRGQYKAEGSITIYREEWQELIKILQTLVPGGGYMEANFDVIVTYGELLLPTTTDTLKGCRIKKAEHSLAEGSDALVIKADLSIAHILDNDLIPFAGMIK